MKSLKLLKKRLNEAEVKLTTDINEAIWLLSDGTMIDGGFDYGSRGEDHRIIESGIVNLNRYDGDLFWNSIHYDYKAVRLVPETNYALIKRRQKLTDIQLEMLSETTYEIEKY